MTKEEIREAITALNTVATNLRAQGNYVHVNRALVHLEASIEELQKAVNV